MKLMTPLIDEVRTPGAERFSSARAIGECLRQLAQLEPDFYLFSPDETTSNKLEAIFQVSSRAWANLPTKAWDLPEAPSGRVVELLSENTLFALMCGHIMGQKPAMMTSYEAFFPIITAQIVQHLKFLEQAAGVPWRPTYPAVNLLSTSTCWRQDHNGFSHQSPLLISTLLARPTRRVNCLFPVDDVSAYAATQFMLESRNVVNLATFNKTEEPRWIDSHHARFQFENGGASIFGFASEEQPEVVLTAAGDIATTEALYAVRILKRDLPWLRVRFVGINALTYGAIGTTERTLDQATFDQLFTPDKLIVANFHGYPDALRQILLNYAPAARLSVHGFVEQGSTTTPFEMLALNHASRYDLALDVAARVGERGLVERYQQILAANRRHAEEFGLDLPEVREFEF